MLKLNKNLATSRPQDIQYKMSCHTYQLSHGKRVSLEQNLYAASFQKIGLDVQCNRCKTFNI